MRTSSTSTSSRHRSPSTLAAVTIAVLAASALYGCTRLPEPVRSSREALGTIVTMTVFGGERTTVSAEVDGAFDALSRAERVLSAYPDEAAAPPADSASSTSAVPSLEVTSVAAFNRDPYEWHVLPGDVVTVLERIESLGVQDWFSPGMLRVVGLYDFGGAGRVPDAAELPRLVTAAKAFQTRATARGLEARFARTGTLTTDSDPPESSFAPPAVGLDLSGASKGAALDAAMTSLRDEGSRGDLTGVLVSAGSTTLVWGRKPTAGGFEAWRVGIEDPRNPDQILGVVEYSLDASNTKDSSTPLGTVSTSGDYQQSFVRDGIRYHHVLDPATGKPAKGIRSLTVVGAASGLDSDLLSTALFVMGVDGAQDYARAHGLGLFIVDAQGRTRIVPGPDGAPFTIRKGDS